MTSKQEHLLRLLKEIDQICRRHQLRYVMAGGSLIGVVRHEGFVPWDDDVDIYMPKKDWDILVSVSDREFPPDRAVQCVDVTRNYTNTFPRYADTSSCVIHRHQIIADDKAGEIIDVLTLDPIPDDDREYEKYRTHMMIYSELVGISTIYCPRWEIPVTKYWKYLLSSKLLGRDRTLKKLEKIMFSYDEEECGRYAMRWGGCPFLFDKDMMFPVKYGKFEGMEVMIPARTSDYLIWHYGDEWSYIPSHDERTAHMAVTVEGVGYEEFRREYLPGLDARKIARDAVVRKSWQCIWAKKDHRMHKERIRLYEKCVVMDLKALLKRENIHLDELVNTRQFGRLNEIFSKYYQAQFDALFIGREDFSGIYLFRNPVFIHLEEDIFRAAVITLFYTERVAKAYRILQVKEQVQGLTEWEKTLMGDILRFREAVGYYEKRELNKSEKICGELLKKYPEHPSFLKLRCRFIMERAGSRQDTSEARKFFDEVRREFPKDSYFLKYKGDILWMEGRRETALELYGRVRSSSVVNGIVQLELDRFLQGEKRKIMPIVEEKAAAGEGTEVREILEKWKTLLPEDIWIHTVLFCLRVSEAYGLKELMNLEEEAVREYSQFTGAKAELPEKKMIRDALVRIAEKYGFRDGEAELRADISLETEDEKLAELLKRAQSLKNPGTAGALAGDIYFRRGRTDLACEKYKEALGNPLPEPMGEMLKNELQNKAGTYFSEGQENRSE